MPMELIERLADAAAAGGARIEVDERWSCPSAADDRSLRRARRRAALEHRQPPARDDRPLRPLSRRSRDARDRPLRRRQPSRAARADPDHCPPSSGPCGPRPGRGDPTARRLLPVRAGRAATGCASAGRSRRSTRGSRSIVPAWNEGAVIGRTLDRLVGLEYPPDRLRIYVVDDASTDETPEIVRCEGGGAPGPRLPPAPRERRRGQGGTINHGLGVIRAEGWYEAVLIIDADVILTPRRPADDDPPPGRPRGRRGHRLHQGGQPTRRLPEPLRRLRVHHRSGRGPAGSERPRRPGLPGGRLAAVTAREPRADRRADRHHHAGRGHRDDLQPAAHREAGRVRAQRDRLGRGAAEARRALEAAAALGARQRPGHPALLATSGCGAGTAAGWAASASR